MVKFNFQETANILHLVKQVSLLNLLPSDAEVEEFDHVDILIEGGAMRVKTVVNSGVEARDASFATEGDHVGCTTVVLIEVPVVVCPQLARLTISRASLIHNEWNTVLFAHSTQLFVEHGSCRFVSVRSDWLNYDSADISSVRFLLTNDFTEFSEASFLFLLVSFFVLSERVLQLRQRCGRPLVGGNASVVHSGVRGGEHGDRGAMRSGLEAEGHTLGVITSVLHGILHEADGNCGLVSGGDGAVREVHLVSAVGRHRHHVLAEQVGVVLGRHHGAIGAALEEPIEVLLKTRFDTGVVIVTKSDRASQIENSVAVNVHNVVVFAHFEVHERVSSLLRAVKVVGGDCLFSSSLCFSSEVNILRSKRLISIAVGDADTCEPVILPGDEFDHVS